jgi:hypothetical protein
MGFSSIYVPISSISFDVRESELRQHIEGSASVSGDEGDLSGPLVSKAEITNTHSVEVPPQQ